MSWIDNVLPPKIRSFLNKRETPENLWVKDPESGEMVFYRDLEANQWVVPGSGYHMKIKAGDRMANFLDGGKYDSVPLPAVADDVSSNPTAAPSASNPYGWAPHVVTFKFVTKGPGEYAWNCEFPCGGNYAGMGEAMSSYGYMSGVIHVV